MKKTVVILIALLIIGGTQAVTRAQQQGEQWVLSATYSAPDGSVSIQYPKEWTVTPVTSVPGMVATFLTPSGSVNRMYAELSVGEYQNMTTLSDIKNYFISEPESNGSTLTPTQIAGHPAFRADGPLEDGATGTFALYIDFDGTLVVLSFQGGVEAPDDFDAADVAMILAMASSVQIPAGHAPSATEAATAAAGTSSTTTFVVEDYLYALTSPASWPWTSDYVGNGTATMFDLADGISGSITTRVNPNGLSMLDYLTTYWQKPMSSPDLLAVTKLDLPGLDAAQGIYNHAGSGQIYLVSMREQVIVIAMNGDDAVLRSQNAAILAMVASIVPGKEAAKSAAAYAAEYAVVPEVTAPPPTPTTAPVACSVTASSSANLRSGPGTSFAKAGALAAGVTQAVTGQATGSDGKVWYQLDGGYVRSDLVAANGDCASVPTVTP